MRLGKFIHSIIKNQKQVIVFRTHQQILFQFNSNVSTPMTHRLATACPFNENSAHGFSGRIEEMSLALEFIASLLGQSEPGFMHKGRCLQSLPWDFVRELMLGKPP